MRVPLQARGRSSAPHNRESLLVTNLHSTPAPAEPILFHGIRRALRGAVRGARRAWAIRRERRREARHRRQALRERFEADDRLLADLDRSRGDLPWFTQRDAFAQFLDDHAARRSAILADRAADADRTRITVSRVPDRPPTGTCPPCHG